MVFTCHHTCSKSGGKEYIHKNAPFLSEYNPEKGKKPFLGEGYYFWEYNFDYAKVWGNINYHGYYFVCECDVRIDVEKESLFLDLVGNRKHLCGFVELLREFNLIHEEGAKGIDLCYIINYLRNKLPEEAFPFKIIRAVDYQNSNKEGIRIEFNDKPSSKSYTILNPRVIIAYKNKEDIIYLNELFIKFAS